MRINELTMHGVKSIELSNTYVENSGSRTLRVTNHHGDSFELTLYGETSVLDALPKSPDFTAFTKTPEDEAA